MRELADATQRAIASNEQVVETRARVERGQGELFLLLATPCGTVAEGSR